jgi:hypothetical protein
MRFRKDITANYKAVFLDNGKTIRFKLDNNKPFGKLAIPEIEDVAINDKCYANCSYCYTSATNKGSNFENILDKAKEVWGNQPLFNRPFQIAIGGAGESTIHPQWCDFVKYVHGLQIVPNYTTNGMHLKEEILNCTEKYCGGVALSWHPHIEKVFHEAANKLKTVKTRLNFHIIVGDEQSLFDLQRLYDQYKDIVEYFVILPYQNVGRAKKIATENVWKQCFNWIGAVKENKFAFGALFYGFLQKNNVNLDMAIYEPEVFSGYRMLNDNYKTVYKSSYDLTPKDSNEKIIHLPTASFN